MNKPLGLNLPTHQSPLMKGIDTTHQLNALVLNIANHIETKQLKSLPLISLAPLTVRLPSSGAAVIFRFGCVVLFHSFKFLILMVRINKFNNNKE